MLLLKSHTIEFDDQEGFLARITVRRGSILEELAREQLIQEGREYPEGDDLFSRAKKTAAIVLWPTLYAGTVEAVFGLDEEPLENAWPCDFETFLGYSLPEDLIDAWMQAVWKLNPRWAPTPVALTDEEKQAEKKD